MIHKTVLLAAFSALLFTGCDQKQPQPNFNASGMNNISDVAQIAGETVSINENIYKKNANSKDSNKNTTASSKHNSSHDGFQSIYFGFGGYVVSADMESSNAINTSAVKKTNAKVKIEGNCDEFGTDEYNYALGLKRAKAVKDSIVAQGVDANKMVIISFGESNPVCSNPTDECYAQNRRVDLRLVK